MSKVHSLPINILHQMSTLYSSAVDEGILKFRGGLVQVGCALGDPNCVLIIVLNTPDQGRQTRLYENALHQIKEMAKTRSNDPLGLRAALIMNLLLMQKDLEAGRLEAEKLVKLFDDLPDSSENKSLHARLLYLAARAEMETRKDKDKARAYLEKAAYQLDDGAAYWMLSDQMDEGGENHDSVKMTEYLTKATASGIVQAFFSTGLAKYTQKEDAIRNKWSTLADRRWFGMIRPRHLAHFLFPTGVSSTPSLRGTISRLLFHLEAWTWDTDTSIAKEWFRLASDAGVERAQNSLLYMELMMGEKTGDLDKWISSQDPTLSESDRRDAAEMSMNMRTTMERENQDFLKSMGIHNLFTFSGRRIK
jgi:TPR repeat protein